MKKDEIIKSIIKEVNRTLDIFTAGGYTLAKRWTYAYEPEKALTFCQLVEIRFNHECYIFLPDEFKKLLEFSDGHLFVATEIIKPNEKKRKFDSVTLKINEFPEDVPEEILESFKSFKKWFDGNTITFTSQKKKFTFSIK